MDPYLHHPKTIPKTALARNQNKFPPQSHQFQETAKQTVDRSQPGKWGEIYEREWLIIRTYVCRSTLVRTDSNGNAKMWPLTPARHVSVIPPTMHHGSRLDSRASPRTFALLRARNNTRTRATKPLIRLFILVNVGYETTCRPSWH